MNIFYDIETDENDRCEEYYKKKKYKPASNIKDPKKIKANIEAKREADRKSACLHWWTNQVWIISMSWHEFSWTASREDYNNSESDLLKAFSRELNGIGCEVTLIGKNSEELDRPVLIGRYMANNLSIPYALYDHRKIFDVQHIFGRSRASSQVCSLDDMAWGLGLYGKTYTWEQIQELRRNKETAEEKHYCEQDVAITREVFQRYVCEVL